MKHLLNMLSFAIAFLCLHQSNIYAKGAPFTNPETNQPHKFVAANYTDLGVNFEGQMTSSESTLRSRAGAELNRLRDAGITNVRVWPFLHHGDNLTRMANRVAWLADEAARRDMTITVDLFDSSGNNTYANIKANESKIDSRISGIIRPNANKRNIYWSLGNEIGGHENPLAFATFYEQKVAAMRDAGAMHISFHPVPGSLEHRWGSNNDTEKAARRCIKVSDDVSPHFYAVGSVSNESSANWTEFNSLQQYINIAHELCKPTIIGEFGITGNCGENYSQRTDNNVKGWLNYFDNTLKVDQVSFWQFMKNTLGHLDDQCFASVSGSCIGNGTHQDAMSGYLNDRPANPGNCNTPPPPPVSGSCDALNFNSYSVVRHDTGQDRGSSTKRDNGATLEIKNNAWKAIEVNYNITSNTVISFDFKSTIEGEIHGILFDNNTTLNHSGDADHKRAFRVHGAQDWGKSNYNTYSGNSSYQSFTIPVGQFYTGQFKYLVFIGDHDASPQNANGFFSNLKIYERGQCDNSGSTCEVLSNNKFNSNTSGWQNWGCSTSVSNGIANITNITTGTNVWNVGFRQNNVSLQQGKTYTLSVRAKADNNRSIILKAMLDQSPWATYTHHTINLSRTMKTYTFNFTMNQASTNKVKVELLLGSSNTNVRVDYVSLTTACNNKEELSLAPDIQLYPNPATSVINVQYELPQNTSVNITVFDAFGKLVKNVSNVELLAGEQTLDMDVSNLSAGMYFYTLQASEWKATKKFIIVK